MKFYWSINSLPEVRAIPVHHRKKMLGLWKLERPIVAAGGCLVRAFILISLFPTVIYLVSRALSAGAGSLLSWELIFTGWALLCAGVTMAHLYLARRSLRSFLAEEARRREAFCLKCGYDLRGTPGPICPECGAVILYSK